MRPASPRAPRSPSTTAKARRSRRRTPTASAAPSSATWRRAAATASACGRRAGIGAAAGPHDPVGAAQHRHLRPVDPVQRVRVPDHARRDQAGDRRPPAAGRDARPSRGRTAAAAERPDADPDRVLGLRVRRTRPARESGISILANLMGFTVVDVNMRGTGCSGGAFDFFEPLQSLDGYDVIETIAHQPWVLHHKVGMMGISYGGISQLFTAATQPPRPGRDLAAVGDRQHPDDALSGRHPQHRLRARVGAKSGSTTPKRRPRPAARHGPTSASRRATRPARPTRPCTPRRSTCSRRSKKTTTTCPRSPTRSRRSPSSTRSTCRPSWPASGPTSRPAATARPSPSTSPARTRKWFTFTNGTHVDSLDPATFNRWYDFLQLYVAKRPPILASAAIQAAAPLIYQEAMGIPGVTLPPDPIQLQPTYELALAAFENLKPVRVLFDNGAGGLSPGRPYPGFEKSFDELPGPRHRGQGLVPRRRTAPRAAARPPAAAPTSSPGTPTPCRGPISAATPPPAPAASGPRRPNTNGRRARRGAPSPTSPRRSSANTTVIGAGAVNVWVRSSTPNVDLQATISEVRPDGKETFVQNGWVRGNARKLDAEKSTAARAGAEPARIRRLPAARRPVRARSRSRSTTRATPTAPARGSG